MQQLQAISIRFHVAEFTVPLAGGTVTPLLEPNPMRYACGFVSGEKGGAINVSTNPNMTNGDGALIENDLKWFDVPKYGPLPFQSWFALLNAAATKITVFEVIDLGKR